MGICVSIPETDISDRKSDVTDGDWDSYTECEMEENGTTASVSDAGRDGEDDVTSPSQSVDERHDDTNSESNKVVQCDTDFFEKNALREVFSEECLLEKSRKSFNADMRMFAIMFEDSDKTDKK